MLAWCWTVSGIIHAQEQSTEKKIEKDGAITQQELKSNASRETLIKNGTYKLLILVRGRGVPINKAEIRTKNKVFYTDPKGALNIELSDEAKVEIKKTGFEKTELDAQTLTEPGEYQVFLYPALSEDESTIIVKGKRKAEVSRKVISVIEAAKVAPGGDPAQVVKLLPGVQSRAFDSRVIIRGSGPEDSQYYIDNTSVPFIFHPVGSRSVLPEKIIADVEFYSGGFSPRYGWATGGVVVLRTKTDIPEKSKWNLNINLPIYSGVFYEAPLGQGGLESISVSMRKSYLEYIIPRILANNEEAQKADLTITPTFADGHVQYLKKDEVGNYLNLAN